jgi:hypothetical protein
MQSQLLNLTSDLMKIYLFTLTLSLSILRVAAQSEVPPAEAQIRSAVLAAPADKRDGASVYGYNVKNELVLLRKGTNEMICLADDPGQDGFNASCYHQNLSAFMKRGRALKKLGKSPKEIFEIREKEVKAGKLTMPKQPSTMFVFSASAENYDQNTGEVKEGNFRYVVYIPYATAESTGLPLKPEAPGMPWIMDPGTHRAHIMINPPAKE